MERAQEGKKLAAQLLRMGRRRAREQRECSGVGREGRTPESGCHGNLEKKDRGGGRELATASDVVEIPEDKG